MASGDAETPSTGSSGSSSPGRAGGGRGHATVTELELEFAQNPDSGVFAELCAAYLDQSRFMEAMVVCKKGIKANPDDLDAKVLLTRVYARQKKYSRALGELDKLVDKYGDSALVFFTRGQTRLAAGDQDAAVEDLKKAVDLDDSSEAQAALAEIGIEYPEKVEAPPPPPPPSASHVAPLAQAAADNHSSAPAGSQTPVGRGSSVSVTPVTPGRSALPRAGSMAMPPQGHAPDAPFQVMPQRLEGEDKLEALAVAVANEKPKQGKPKVTIILVAVLAVFSTAVIAQRLLHKRKIEAIDRLTTAAVPAFNRDTYAGYKKAARLFEEIVDDYDDEHPLSVARLAHTYAILGGEHAEVEAQAKLANALAMAQKVAPDVSHTVAARTLATLYAGSDRRAVAKTAVDQAQDYVAKNKAAGAAPTHADLALGIAELQLGEYEASVRRLSRVAEVLPGSVRAKVWHARAAFRAGRLATAVSAFAAALRTEPDHSGARAASSLARLRRGDLQGAAGDLLKFDAAVQANPKDVSRKDAALAEFARSEVWRSAGEDAKATGAYEQAIRLDPENPDFAFGLGQWLLANYRFKEALTPLRKAVEQDPNRSSFRVALAEAEMRSGNWKEAEEQINKASTMAPESVEAKLARARLMRRRKMKGVEAFLNDLEAKHPSHATQVKLERGRYLRSVDKLPAARKALEEAIEGMSRVPRSNQAEVLLSYGKLMEDAGEGAIALNSYKQAANRGAIEGWYRVSIALAKTGERKKAKAACERYLAAGTSLRYSNNARKLCASL